MRFWGANESALDCVQCNWAYCRIMFRERDCVLGGLSGSLRSVYGESPFDKRLTTSMIWLSGVDSGVDAMRLARPLSIYSLTTDSLSSFDASSPSLGWPVTLTVKSPKAASVAAIIVT